MMTPKVRQILYSVGVVAFSALTILSTLRLIDPNTAASVSAALTAVLGMFGVSVAGTAAYNVTKQQHDGAFNPTPEVSASDRVIGGINEVIAQAQNAQAEVDRVTTAVAQAAKDVPAIGSALGPLAQQAIDSLPRVP